MCPLPSSVASSLGVDADVNTPSDFNGLENTVWASWFPTTSNEALGQSACELLANVEWQGIDNWEFVNGGQGLAAEFVDALSHVTDYTPGAPYISDSVASIGWPTAIRNSTHGYGRWGAGKLRSTHTYPSTCSGRCDAIHISEEFGSIDDYENGGSSTMANADKQMVWNLIGTDTLTIPQCCKWR